jgi:hypothetical protein
VTFANAGPSDVADAPIIRSVQVEHLEREQLTRWENRVPTYTVHFWDRVSLPGGGLGGDRVDRYLISNCDVDDVLAWASAEARGRTVVYVNSDRGQDEPGLIRLHGVDPTI